MSEPQSLSPTPVKYPGLSLLAKGLAGVNSFATAEDKAVPGKKANALLSGLASLAGLPEAQALMEKLAYGERLTTGKGQTLKPAENVVEGALALAPLAQGLARGAVKVAGKIPTQRDSDLAALFGPKVFGNLPAAPGTAEVPEGFVRLYHQTSPEAAKAIKRTGLSIEHAKGIEGPRAIYASETGFYGDPSKRPTVEFQIPKDQFESPFVLKDISPDELTAVHLPWHDKARYILENPKTLEQTLAGQFDNLDGDYAKAVRYIKQNYLKLTKGLAGK